MKTKIYSIKSVEPLGYVDDYVYDIEMMDKENPYFFGNNILVHNSTYFKIPVDNIEDAIEIADGVAELVNKSYPKFMRKAFLCNDGYDQLIQCGREIVADSGIFVSKKMYTLHVVDNEGETMDYLKTMGLALKKTTVPKPIAKKLSEYVKRILLKEPWDVISKDIVQYKKDLAHVDNIFNIGLPKGINGLEDYTAKFYDGFKGTIPGHVMASICYNEMLREYNDSENYPITSGMKIRTFYFKKPLGRFKSIALPTDLDNIPTWFLNNIVEKLDIELQVEKLVDDSLRNILEAIDFKIPSEQSLYSEEFFEF